MKHIILSIIIVSFNSQKYLDYCLQSLFKSDFVKDFAQILIVDNASTDNTVEVIRKKFPKVKIIQNKKNLGFASANNQAIRLSSGKYVLLLNPDTIIPNNSLKVMVDFMEKNPDCAVSTCRVELPQGILDDACHRGFPTPINAFFYFIGLANLFVYSKFFNGYHLGYQNLDKIHQIDSCTGAFMLIRRSVGEKLNWLDEDYFWYGEDLDFCYRVNQHLFQVMFVPQVKIIHYKGISSGIKKHSQNLSSADVKTKYRATRARFEVMRIFYRKHYQHYSPWLSSLVLFGIKIKEIIEILKFKWKGQYAHRI